MRRAYIGLSTPIGFDFRNPASKAPADTASSPNPVLDSPFGLLLLFDELVFATRSLCPENMRHLPYVSFLDESGKLPYLTETDLDDTAEKVYGDYWMEVRNQACLDRPDFSEIIAASGATWWEGIDNHSHGLKIGSVHKQANADEYNLLLDMLICSRVGDPSMELIANSRLQPFLDQGAAHSAEAHLTELLVLDGVPNYLTKTGPYHPVIEEVRENPYIAHFRKWITSTQTIPSRAEAREVKFEVEEQLRDAQERLFLKHLDPKNHFVSVGKAMLGDAIGVLCPVTGTVTAVAEEVNNWRTAKNMRWQGFLIGARRATRGKAAS